MGKNKSDLEVVDEEVNTTNDSISLDSTINAENHKNNVFEKLMQSQDSGNFSS